ncbi:MAG: tetratricopeptide repeat protein [Armatimonadota bacterium]
MPECSKCFTFIPADANKCPKCGVPVSNGETLDPEFARIEDKVHALLISSNLMKLRGDLDGAIQECIKALRVNPDSLEAHSLLGDIYRDQGNIEEAERWYQLALDLKPDSAVDTRRLEQLKCLNNTGQAAPDKTPIASAAMINWVTVGVLSAIILVLLTAIIWPLLPNISGEEPDDVQAPSISNLGQRARRIPNPPAASTQAVMSSAHESSVMKDINSSSALSGSHLQVINSTIDPRHNTAVLTFIGPVIADNERMAQLVKDCLIIAKEVFQRDTTLTQVTVRALYSIPVNGEQRSEVVFIADSKRESAVQVDPGTADYSQQIASLENVWYHPGIMPTTVPAQPQ